MRRIYRGHTVPYSTPGTVGYGVPQGIPYTVLLEIAMYTLYCRALYYCRSTSFSENIVSEPRNQSWLRSQKLSGRTHRSASELSHTIRH